MSFYLVQKHQDAQEKFEKIMIIKIVKNQKDKDRAKIVKIVKECQDKGDMFLASEQGQKQIAYLSEGVTNTEIGFSLIKLAISHIKVKCIEEKVLKGDFL